jgi:hypothetical protein
MSSEGRPVAEYHEEHAKSIPPKQFVIMPPSELKKKREEERLQKLKVKEIENNRLEQFLHHPAPGTMYTAVMLLTDRAEFVGGNIIIDKPINTEITGNGSGESEEMYDDEESSSSTSSNVDADREEKVASKSTEPEGHTPERASLFLLPPNTRLGTDESKFGKRQALVLEFWAYNDAPMQNERPSEQSGKALGLFESSKHKEL